MCPFIKAGPFSIPTAGISILIGAFLAFLLLRFTWKYRTVPRSDIFYTALYAVIGGIIGSKLLFIITEIPAIIKNPQILLELMMGGAVFYGGLIGGLAGSLIYSRQYKTSIMESWDVFAPSMALAHSFGRLGCFFTGCCYGMEYHGPLSVVYPPGSYPPSGIPLLPTQLIEAAFLLLLAIFLLIRLSRSRHPGGTSGLYLVIYAVWRFIIEFFRADPRGSVWFLSTSQLVSLLLLPLGLYLLIRTKITTK